MHFFKILTFSTLLVSSSVFAVDPAEYDLERFVGSCQSAGNMDEPMCICLGERAETDLTPEGFVFLTATLEKDEQTTIDMRQTMPVGDLADAGMFLVTGSVACAQ